MLTPPRACNTQSKGKYAKVFLYTPHPAVQVYSNAAGYHERESRLLCKDAYKVLLGSIVRFVACSRRVISNGLMQWWYQIIIFCLHKTFLSMSLKVTLASCGYHYSVEPMLFPQLLLSLEGRWLLGLTQRDCRALALASCGLGDPYRVL